MENIGDRLKIWRKSNNLTLKDIHDKTGISRGNLSDIENNKVIPSGKTLLALINEFNVSADWILSGNTSSNNNNEYTDKLLKYFNKLDKQNKRLAVHEMKHMYEVQELKKLRD